MFLIGQRKYVKHYVRNGRPCIEIEEERRGKVVYSNEIVYSKHTPAIRFQVTTIEWHHMQIRTHLTQHDCILQFPIQLNRSNNFQMSYFSEFLALEVFSVRERHTQEDEKPGFCFLLSPVKSDNNRCERDRRIEIRRHPLKMANKLIRFDSHTLIQSNNTPDPVDSQTHGKRNAKL